MCQLKTHTAFYYQYVRKQARYQRYITYVKIAQGYARGSMYSTEPPSFAGAGSLCPSTSPCLLLGPPSIWDLAVKSLFHSDLFSCQAPALAWVLPSYLSPADTKEEAPAAASSRPPTVHKYVGRGAGRTPTRPTSSSPLPAKSVFILFSGEDRASGRVGFSASACKEIKMYKCNSPFFLII